MLRIFKLLLAGSAAWLCSDVAVLAAASVGNMDKVDVLAVMGRVADWQLQHMPAKPEIRWEHGALYAGFMAMGDLVADPKYREAMRTIGRARQWAFETPHTTWYADHVCVGQMYCELYAIDRDPAMIAPLRKLLDEQLAADRKDGFWWKWADAMFMAPPVWTRMFALTGERKYLDFMNRQWWLTAGDLYDGAERLYYRDTRFREMKESNGAKVFWSRGNGWVMGALVRVLQGMPADYPDRGKYVTQFQQMAGRLLEIQPADGLWRSSLLDPGSYPAPETSGSAFFCYAFAWGVNHGLLDRSKFEPAIRKAWAGLVGCVDADGKLTHVQLVGDRPAMVDPTHTHLYGVGGFLLAGSEVYRMGLLRDVPHMSFEAGNSTEQFQTRKSVEIPEVPLQTIQGRQTLAPAGK